MTETPDNAAKTAAPAKKRGGLNGLLLADLKAMANAMGIQGANSLKKAQLVEAIRSHQDAHQARSEKAAEPTRTEKPAVQTGNEPSTEQPAQRKGRARAKAGNEATRAPSDAGASGEKRGAKDESSKADNAAGPAEQGAASRSDEGDNAGGQSRRRERNRGNRGEQSGSSRQANQQTGNQQTGNQQTGNQQAGEKSGGDKAAADKSQDAGGDKQRQRQNQQQKNQNQGQQNQQSGQQGQQNQQSQGNRHEQQDDYDDEGSGRNRRRRGRERDRRRGEPDTTILEDDVLVPAAGILDVLENYAFVRTTGYASGPDDVYLSLSLVRKFGLRSGDAVVGQVRQPREGERREKFNPMVRIDLVNGTDPETMAERPEFTEMTPVHPTERLRLETTGEEEVGRVVDLLAPIGKGQRALIVAPSGSGRTRVLRTMAAALTRNNPESHLMVVLLDERPEEVTDFQRSVKGEVIASTFDRPVTDHTSVAELAIDRAKRLVELGHDVVVLMDGLTRLGRAHNLGAPANGRTLPSGVDVSALHPPKRLFGSARNLEDGGSLTIIATVVVDSGSPVDEAIYEEFQGTANSELHLRREYVDKRLFPAVDVIHSATRRDDLLLAEDEAGAVNALRRTLGGDPEEALVNLLELVRSSRSNADLLARVTRSVRG